MKLFIIVLCLLSERYLVHALSHSRFQWFSSYFNAITQRLPKKEGMSNQALLLALVVLPLVFIVWLLLFSLGHLFFGFIGLLLNLVIFYYCLGPQNPFYPVRKEDEAEDDEEAVVGNYFAKVNGELFAVIFWYIVTGPVGLLLYRLIALSKEQPLTADLAQRITDLLDWIPARLTLLLYLLVGNFQRGVNFFVQKIFSPPKNNHNLLSEGGLLAARTNDNDTVPMPYAENLVEHALIVALVLLAFFTLVAWL